MDCYHGQLERFPVRQSSSMVSLLEGFSDKRRRDGRGKSRQVAVGPQDHSNLCIVLEIWNVYNGTIRLRLELAYHWLAK